MKFETKTCTDEELYFFHTNDEHRHAGSISAILEMMGYRVITKERVQKVVGRCQDCGGGLGLPFDPDTHGDEIFFALTSRPP